MVKLVSEASSIDVYLHNTNRLCLLFGPCQDVFSHKRSKIDLVVFVCFLAFSHYMDYEAEFMR